MKTIVIAGCLFKVSKKRYKELQDVIRKEKGLRMKEWNTNNLID
jgi:hypothetical protein